MDNERDRLLAALRHKLTELDARVVAYRRDRADEFRRYAVDLLAPVDARVVADVAEALQGPAATSLASDYGALYPGFLDADSVGGMSILTPPPASHTLPRRTASPPPVLYHTSGVPKDGPRRPPSPPSHSRHNDFRGVFTPPFLPLLDSSSYARRPSDADAATSHTRAPVNTAGRHSTTDADAVADAAASAAAASAAAATAASDAAAAEAVKADETAAAAAAAAAAVAAAAAPPPAPKLKSALRRSSSISSSRSSTPSGSLPVRACADTRRVRFSFGGEEVLPTSSPPRELQHDLPWLLHDDGSDSAPPMDSVDDVTHSQGTDAGGRGTNGAATNLALNHSLGSAAPEIIDSDQHGSRARGGGDAAGEQETGARPGDESQPRSAQGDSTATTKASHASGSGSSSPPPLPVAAAATAAAAASVPAPLALASAPLSSTPPTPPSPPQSRRWHSQVLDDDDSLGMVPLSRRVSSSDRLRALSKMPLEDPSMWTVVNPQADNSESDGSAPPTVHEIISTHSQNHPQPQQQQSPPVPFRVGDSAGSSDEASSSSDEDEGFFAMRPARRQSTSASPPTATGNQAAVLDVAPTLPTRLTTAGKAVDTTLSGSTKDFSGVSTASPRRAVQVQFVDGERPGQTAVGADDDGDDGFFDIEIDGAETVGYPLARVSNANSHFEEEDEPDDETNGEVGGGAFNDGVRGISPEAEQDTAAADAADAHEAPGAKSPATEVPVQSDDALVAKEKVALGIGTDGLDSNHFVFNHRKALGAAAGRERGSSGAGGGPSSSLPLMPPVGGSVGSYRGRPMDLFNVVKDPRVLQEAAELGDFDTFVGSIHDRHKPSTMAEFSSLSGPGKMSLLSGTPRSLTERMAMEDARAFFSSSAPRHR